MPDREGYLQKKGIKSNTTLSVGIYDQRANPDGETV